MPIYTEKMCIHVVWSLKTYTFNGHPVGLDVRCTMYDGRLVLRLGGLTAPPGRRLDVTPLSPSCVKSCMPWKCGKRQHMQRNTRMVGGPSVCQIVCSMVCTKVCTGVCNRICTRVCTRVCPVEMITSSEQVFDVRLSLLGCVQCPMFDAR